MACAWRPGRAQTVKWAVWGALRAAPGNPLLLHLSRLLLPWVRACLTDDLGPALVPPLTSHAWGGRLPAAAQAQSPAKTRAPQGYTSDSFFTPSVLPEPGIPKAQDPCFALYGSRASGLWEKGKGSKESASQR